MSSCALPPYSLTWTVIPCVSHLVPFVGHLGITDSQSNQYDFGGSYFVHSDRSETIFGEPCRYYSMEDELSDTQKRDWDDAIRKSVQKFEKRQYSLMLNNCHDFVADVFNQLDIGDKRHGPINLVLDYRFKMKKLRDFC